MSSKEPHREYTDLEKAYFRGQESNTGYINSLKAQLSAKEQECERLKETATVTINTQFYEGLSEDDFKELFAKLGFRVEQCPESNEWIADRNHEGGAIIVQTEALNKLPFEIILSYQAIYTAKQQQINELRKRCEDLEAENRRIQNAFDAYQEQF